MGEVFLFILLVDFPLYNRTKQDKVVFFGEKELLSIDFLEFRWSNDTAKQLMNSFYEFLFFSFLYRYIAKF